MRKQPVVRARVSHTVAEAMRASLEGTPPAAPFPRPFVWHASCIRSCIRSRLSGDRDRLRAEAATRTLLHNFGELARRALVVDEGWRTGSLAGEISARIAEEAFYDLDAPVERICSAEVPIPYPRHLEEAALPQADSIVGAAQKMVGKHG
jgi:hypothetical protein